MIYIKGVIGQDVDLVDVVAAAKADNEPILRVMIDSPGGFVDVGDQIYKFLKNYSEREVHTYARGECASMAAQIFITGKQRFIGCQYMIHNPAIQPQGERFESDDLRAGADQLDEIKKNAIKEYKAVTGLDEATLSDLMDNETWLDPDKAVALGFATQKYEFKAVALYGVAKKDNSNNKKEINMKKGLKDAVMQVVNAIFGDEPKPVNLTLTDVNGNELVVTREEGEPQVGDAATPDGEFTMPDGQVIKVEGGVITEIVMPEPDQTEELKKQLAEKDAEIEQLKADLASAKSQVTQVATLLKETLEGAEADEKELATLRAKQQKTGTYKPENRAPGKNVDEKSDIIAYAEKRKAERDAKKNK